ncbi:MAG TPA: hypothetical protein DEP35_16165, partial [Deltaproteobacteria bacterium]|nr:hypothetical protein [Deltaproteobacteria bacterium]
LRGLRLRSPKQLPLDAPTVRSLGLSGSCATGVWLRAEGAYGSPRGAGASVRRDQGGSAFEDRPLGSEHY